jgi:ubiquinone/menaquinone biosynthesis C-methylase UbiE
MRFAFLRLSFVFALLAAGCRESAPEQATATPELRPTTPVERRADSEHYESREASTDGIGKLYLGREISQVMSYEGAKWLDREEREEEEQPELVVQNLDLGPTHVVADVGAGTGYFALRITRRVPAGRVYAVDVQPQMVELLRQKLAEAKVENVEPVLGTETDPKLPDASLDLALMVDVYHELSHPREVMEKLHRALRPGARLVLVEYRAEDPDVPMKPLHKMTEAQARKELESVGFRFVENRDFLPRQHFLVFERI